MAALSMAEAYSPKAEIARRRFIRSARFGGSFQWLIQMKISGMDRERAEEIRKAMVSEVGSFITCDNSTHIQVVLPELPRGSALEAGVALIWDHLLLSGMTHTDVVMGRAAVYSSHLTGEQSAPTNRETFVARLAEIIADMYSVGEHDELVYDRPEYELSLALPDSEQRDLILKELDSPEILDLELSGNPIACLYSFCKIHSQKISNISESVDFGISAAAPASEWVHV